MEAYLNTPLFGIVLSLGAFAVGTWIHKKLKFPLANPLLIAICLVILVLQFFSIPVAYYQQGGNFLSLFLAPATASLALQIYRQRTLLQKALLPILIGSAVGSLSSMGSVYLLCKWFRLEDTLTMSLLPKSVTTPIAMELSEQFGGIPSVTVAAVVLTGIMGAIFAPLLIKLFRVKDPIAAGVAIGTSSHALGTSKALEIGETEGAMSGIAIGTAGLMTVLFSILFLS